MEFVLERDASALFFEQRTGKTYITLAAIERLPRKNMAIVLVCLLNNKDSTWADKIAQLLPWMNVASTWEEFKKLPFPKTFLLHFESLGKVAAKIKRVKWMTFAVIDEAHRLKARGTAQSRAAAKLSGIPKRLILTGTPIEKQPKDLWAQFRFLLPDLFGSWKHFEDRYMDFERIDMQGIKPGSARWQIKIMKQGMLRSRAPFREDMLPEFTRKIKPYALRLTKLDTGILEPEVVRVPVKITGRQRRLYDTMKKHSVIHLGGGSRAMAPLTVTNIIKRRQIVSGFVYDDDGECQSTGSAKLKHLLKLFADLPKPIVVFTCFKPELTFISDALKAEGYAIKTVSGSTPKKQRPGIWRNFQRARYDGLVVQTKVGGVGVDLWKANSAIVHSMGYSSIDFDQMKSRLDAKDKRVAAKIYVLCGLATIDDDLFSMVVEKGMTSREVLQTLKKGAR